MLRMAHRVLSGGVVMPAGLEDWRRRLLVSSIGISTIVVADNAFELFWDDIQRHQQQWETAIRCPNFRLQFIRLFVEFNTLPGMNIRQVGVLFRETSDVALLEECARWHCFRSPLNTAVVAEIVIDFGDGVARSPGIGYGIGVDCDGEVMGMWRTTANGAMQFKESDYDFFRSYVVGAMWAVSFMNCKNVTMNDATDSIGPSAKWQRRMRQPKLKYHVLGIDKLKSSLVREGRMYEVGMAKAMHLCRGHFAVYSDEKPLFGKITGQVWRPAHVRGSADSGIVLKDYKIK